MTIEEKILNYAHLSPDEQREVEAYVEEHPEWESLLRTIQRVERWAERVRMLNDPTEDETLALYVVAQRVHPDRIPPELASVFERLEERLASDADLRQRRDAAEERLSELEATVDPIEHFESLVGYTLSDDADANGSDANGSDANGSDANGSDANGSDANGSDATGSNPGEANPDDANGSASGPQEDTANEGSRTREERESSARPAPGASSRRAASSREAPAAGNQQASAQQPSAQAQRDQAQRPAQPASLSSIPRAARWAVAAMLLAVVGYGVLFGVSRATQSPLVALAAMDVEEDVLDAYPVRTRGATASPDDAPSPDALYLKALPLLKEARTSTLGLFPAYDADALREAETLLRDVVERSETESFLWGEALFYLGKVNIAQKDVTTARDLLQRLAQGDTRRSDEAYQILVRLQEIRPAGEAS